MDINNSNPLSNPDKLGYDENEIKDREVKARHPTPEQLLVREAAKYLTAKQKRVWELHNYDRFTQDEIGDKLGISQQVIGRTIKACEKRIAKYCNANKGLLKTLREAVQHEIE